MLLCTLFLMASLQIQVTPTTQLVGSWINQDPSTSGVTEIAFTYNNNAVLQVHVWGKCEPVDCDWGLSEIQLSNGVARAVSDEGFSSTTMEFVLLPDQRLLLVYKSKYNDQSGRNDQDHVEFFVRKEQVAQNAESLAAKSLLTKVSDTYRNLSAARFESEQVVESTNSQSTMRETTFSKTAISQPGKFRVDNTGSAEPSVVISNGTTVWTFFPESNEYIAIPAGKQDVNESPVSPYTFLDQNRGSPKIAGTGRIADTNCTMVTIERDSDHTQTIWIDPTTNFIRKDERKDVSITEGDAFSQMSSTTFSVARVIDNLDAGVFSFDPLRTQAKQRRELQKDAPLTSIGTLAPDFTLRDLDGKEVRLSNLRGKAIVLDFWATWCVPCRSAMPTLELLYRGFKDSGLVVLGIDDEDSEAQREFLAKFGYSFASLVDPTKKVGNLYHVGGIPTTILIDAQGKIRTYGVGESSFESLWNALHSPGVFSKDTSE
jgi:peroxiredoxin/outer membrane lipoprotein-sorting protein